MQKQDLLSGARSLCLLHMLYCQACKLPDRRQVLNICAHHIKAITRFCSTRRAAHCLVSGLTASQLCNKLAQKAVSHACRQACWRSTMRSTRTCWARPCLLARSTRSPTLAPSLSLHTHCPSCIIMSWSTSNHCALMDTALLRLFSLRYRKPGSNAGHGTKWDEQHRSMLCATS